MRTEETLHRRENRDRGAIRRPERGGAPGPPQSSGRANAGRLRRDPLAFLGDLQRGYGDFCVFQVGRQPVVLATDPGVAYEVLITRNRQFVKQNVLLTSGHAPQRAGLSGLVMSDDSATHVRGRRLVQPAFSPARLELRRDVIGSLTDRELSGWHDGDVLDPLPAMSRISVAAALEVLFGGADHESASDAAPAGLELMEGFSLVVGGGSLIGELVRFRRRARFENALARLRSFVGAEIARAGETDDVASLLAQHDQETERVNDGVGILLAGIETTGAALAWALLLLAENPSVADRLRDEAGAAAGDTPLPFAEAVVRETLRLYPPSWFIGRRALADQELCDRQLRAGTVVLLSPYLTHRDASLFDEPARFAPERWQNDTGERPGELRYFPFGGGPRRCLGERLALLECAIVLTRVVRAWRLHVERPLPTPFAGATLVPREPRSIRVAACA